MKADIARPIENLVLASASPRRLQLLAQISIIPNHVVSPDIDETALKNELPLQYAVRIAREKAKKISACFPDKTILAADTVVFCGRTILPKAQDEPTARACLLRLSGRRHKVVTAVAVAKNTIIKVKTTVTLVRFKRLSHQEVNDYIACGEWEGKAGAYAIQGLASAFIPAINGSYSNVVGLPLCETRNMLAAFWVEH